MIPTLRDYQVRAVGATRGAFAASKQSVCLVLPTGGGKTVIFAYIAWTASLRGKKILILVHRKELIRQTAQKLRDFGVEPGIISPQYRPNYNAAIQVAMVQTMVGRGHLYQHFDLVITDECHHVAASTYLKSISRYPQAYNLGVTATPLRTDGKGLGVHAGGIYEHMVVGPQTADLIRQGYLVEPVIHVPPSLVDLTGVRKLGGEYNAKQTTERVDKRSITGDAMDHYLSAAKYEPAVVFCASVAHAEHVAAEWRQAGIRAVSVDGSQRGRDVGRDGSDLVDRALRGLADGSVHSVMSCDLISEGTDIPAISYMADLGPTASLGRHIQKIGRTLRPAPGKDRAIIMDHVGNVGQLIGGEFVPNHGLPTDEREWTLDGEMRSKRAKKEKQGPTVCMCENCYGVFIAALRVCPYCGTERVVKARQIEQQAGELVQLSPETIRKQKAEARMEVGRAKTLEELEAIAAARGYKKSWARIMYDVRNNKQ